MPRLPRRLAVAAGRGNCVFCGIGEGRATSLRGRCGAARTAASSSPSRRDDLRGLANPLSKWLPATWLSSAGKKDRSSHQLARDLGITRTSAWFMRPPHPPRHGDGILRRPRCRERSRGRRDNHWRARSGTSTRTFTTHGTRFASRQGGRHGPSTERGGEVRAKMVPTRRTQEGWG